MVVNFKVFKKVSPNNMITLYMNKREFVDSITVVEPVGEWACVCVNKFSFSGYTTYTAMKSLIIGAFGLTMNLNYTDG